MALLIALLFFGIIGNIFAQSDGEVKVTEENGVCTKTWPFVKTYRESYIHTWYHTYWAYCGWERCRKLQLRSRTDYRTKVEIEEHEDVYCCNGYEKISNNPIQCIPRCSPKCISSNCTSPGVCTCYHGYKPISSYECEPICEPNCINSHCIHHNTCECYEQYNKSLNESHKCYPICHENCINGNCVQPDICECHEGYELSDTNKYLCNIICDNCENGQCFEPYICECNNGYIKINNKCEPNCTKQCIYGKCIAPDQCQCNDGYIKDEHKWNLCIPYCSEPCINAFCTEPEICTCQLDYIQINNNTCEPICNETCIYGECIAPNICSCLDGYMPISNTTCTPYCSEQCINANCTEPELCTCLNGYEKSEYDLNVCEPFCENGCLNEFRNLIENYTDELNGEFNYTITLIHPEELHGIQKGKCDVCMCGNNFRRNIKSNEALFYFTPCRTESKPIVLAKSFKYIFILLAILITTGTLIISIIIYKFRSGSSSYHVRTEKCDEQELTVEEEFLVNNNNNNNNNIHEDD